MTIIILLAVLIFLVGYYFINQETKSEMSIANNDLSDHQKRQMRELKNSLECLENYHSKLKFKVVDEKVVERNKILLTEKKALDNEMMILQSEIEVIANEYLNVLCKKNNLLVDAYSSYCDVEKALENTLDENLKYYINDKGAEVLREYNRNQKIKLEMNKSNEKKSEETASRNWVKEGIRDYWLQRDAYPFPRIE